MNESATGHLLKCRLRKVTEDPESASGTKIVYCNSLPFNGLYASPADWTSPLRSRDEEKKP